MLLETLRDMLLGFAKVPVAPNNADPRYIPIVGDHSRSGDGYSIDIDGYPHNYDAWIHPYGYHHNAGYMGLRVERTDGIVSRITFRVVAYNAGRTYMFVFNFVEGLPPLEMYVGRGVSVTGDRVYYQKVRCIDLLVLDLLDDRLPPQITAHRTEFCSRAEWGHRMKPCLACGAEIHNNWTVCADCRDNKPLEVATV